MNAYEDQGQFTITWDPQTEKLYASPGMIYLPCDGECGKVMTEHDSTVSVMCQDCLEEGKPFPYPPRWEQQRDEVALALTHPKFLIGDLDYTPPISPSRARTSPPKNTSADPSRGTLDCYSHEGKKS